LDYILATIKAAAIEAGLVDHDMIALIERSKVSMDEHGEVHGAAEAVADLKARKPQLFRSERFKTNSQALDAEWEALGKRAR